MEELKNIFNNTNEQVTISVEMRDEIRALTDIVDHFKSMAISQQDSIKNTITETNETIKEIYNANWFIHTENDKNLKSINKSIDNLGKINNKFVEQLQADKDIPDYLEEQREHSKLYQSQMTNKLLGELLKEVKKSKISARVDGDKGGLFSGVSGGLMGMLGLGGGAVATGGVRKGVKGVRSLKMLLKGGKLLTGITGVGLLGVAADELFGISDMLIDEVTEAYTGQEVKREEKTVTDRLKNIGRLVQDARYQIDKFTPNFLKEHHYLVQATDSLWDWVNEATGYEPPDKSNNTGVMNKLAQFGGFFQQNNPMDLMKQLYTDQDAFNKTLDKFTGIALGETIDAVDEAKKGAEKQSQQNKKDKLQEIQNEKKLDTQYQPSANELKPTPEIDKQLADYLANRDERIEEAKKNNEDGKRIKVPPRSSEYNLQDKINEVARNYGIEPSLFKAMIQSESSFNPNAISEDNAYGLGQVREIAAKDVGADWERVKTDPYYNLETSAKYLKKQLDAFGGNKRLALSAYNAGPTATRRAGGVAQNTETKAYVAKTLATQEKYKAREEAVRANREKERTTQLRNMGVAENTPQPQEPSTTYINAPNNNNNIQSDESLTRINPSSPFDLTYAKLMFNPNYNIV